MFRNSSFYRLPPETAAALRDGRIDLEAALAPLRPIGPLERSVRGFTPPLGDSATALSHRVADAIWVRLAGEDRILPAATIKAEVARRKAEIEAQRGEPLRGKALRALRYEVTDALMAKALTKPYRLDAYIDLARALLVVDTASPKQAEGLISALRACLGSFPATPTAPTCDPAAVLTRWLSTGPLPETFELGQECELREPATGGAIWRASKQAMPTSEIETHLEAGKVCTRLAFRAGPTAEATIDDKLILRKLKLAPAEDAASDAPEDIHAELDARFMLLTAEVGAIFDTVAREFSLAEAA